MKHPHLVRLDQLASLTPAALQKQDPEVFAALQQRLGEHVLEALDAHFAGARSSVRDLVKRYRPADPAAADVTRDLTAAFAQAKLSDADRRQAHALLARLHLPTTPKALSPRGAPLATNPLVQAELAAGRAHRLAQSSKLTAKKLDAVAATGVEPIAVGDGDLAALVERHVLTADEAADYGLNLSLYRLLDEDVALAEAVRKASVASLPGKRVRTPADLARIDEAGWEAILADTKATAPAGLSRPQYAQLLARRMAALYPTDALVHRVQQAVTRPTAATIGALDPVADQGRALWDTRTAELDLSNVPQDKLAKVQAAHETLSAAVRANPGLQLGEVLVDTSLSSAQRAERVTALLSANDEFLARNADVELLALDYTPDSDDLQKLDFTAIAEADRPLVVDNLKAYQRAYAVAGESIDAAVLIADGFPGATSIVARGKEAFTASTSLKDEVAGTYFDKAMAIVTKAGLAGAALADHVVGGIDLTTVLNVGPDIDDYFRRIDGFAELFGDQSFCDCEHCRSILGPAAYFADLMCFVELSVLDQVFVGTKAGHVLALRTRRPDLWDLELTCENTTTEIPQLVVVNEILENYLATRRGFAGDLRDRLAVADFVYRQHLATTVDSFAQPLVLAFEQLRIHVGHFDVRLADLVAFTDAAEPVRTAARLDMPAIVRTLITTPDAALATLRRLYNINFEVSGGVVKPFDAQALLRPMGVTRAELGELVASPFVTALGTEPITIRGEKRTAQSVQNDIERVRSARLSSLDRLHRFVRLWRATGWAVGEVDIVDQAIRAAGRGADITAALADVASVAELSRRFGASVEVVAAMFGAIPTHPAREGASPLFDRLFNLPFFVGEDGTYPKDGTTYVHAAHAVDPTTVTGVDTGRLRAGLRVTDDELVELIEALADELGADLAGAADADRGFALTAANLSLLHRHAQLARWLDLSMDELFQAISLAGLPADHLGSLDDVLAVVEFVDRDVDFDHAMVVTGSQPLPEEPTAVAARLVERIDREGGLAFAGTVFAGIGGLTQSESRAIVAANPTAFVALADDDTFRLADDFDPTAALAQPVAAPAPNADVVAALLPHHAGNLLRIALAGELAANQEVAGSLLDLAGIDLFDPALVGSITGTGALDALRDALAPVLRLAALVDAADAKPENVAFIAANPSLFALGDPTALTTETVLLVERFLDLCAEEDDAPLVRALLLAYDPTAGFAAADPADLGQVLGTSPALAASLDVDLARPPAAVDALHRLHQAAELAGRLGVGGDVFVQAASDDYATLAAAAAAVVAAFRTAHPDEDDWQRISQPYAEEVLNRRRDGLVAYHVHSIHPEFETADDLYRYFLLDPEVDGCFPTSRVVAAISSVQAYVHRVLMNLEQSEDGAIHVRPNLVPRDEWEWRKNYRVWEANRKVFLWTENYLDPDVRDDKTPLFEEFEDAILQNELDEQAILDAYATYMEGFEVVANLRVAGSFHDIDDATRTDVLHLIGVTPGDPPSFFYRTIENAIYGETEEDRVTTWGPWSPIDVKIPVRECSPVVFGGRLYVFWVEIVTTPQNEVRDAGSQFVGYKHRCSLRYSRLRLDGRWTAPQEVSFYGTPPFIETDGVIDDPLIEPTELEQFLNAIMSMFGFGVFSTDWDSLDDAQRALFTPRYDDEPHTTSREGYTLATPEWTRPHPEVTAGGIRVNGLGYQVRAAVDLFEKVTTEVATTMRTGRVAWTLNLAPPSPVLCRKNNGLYYGTPGLTLMDDYGYAALVADDQRLARVTKGWPNLMKTLLTNGLYKGRLADLGTAVVHPINGVLVDAVIDDDGDLLLLQSSVRPGNRWLLRRLGTTLARPVARALFTRGVDGLLATSHQESLREAATPITLRSSAVENAVNAGTLDFRGPYGTYYREIFFHIPFLIARTLQAQGNHAEAKHWYEYLFNPTADETIVDDPALSDAQNRARRRDRNWRYREFRKLGLPQLRQILTDAQAISLYKRDPFNPHAIARLRLSAYQKSVVMSYVDNLLDWGDQLFTRFERESVNEAALLYQTAKDILGPRPAQLGECGDDRGGPHTYASLRDKLKRGSEFLVELEHFVSVGGPKGLVADKVKPTFTIDATVAATATWKATLAEALKPAKLGVLGAGHVGGLRTTVDVMAAATGGVSAVVNVPTTPVPLTHTDEPLTDAALTGEPRASRATATPTGAAIDVMAAAGRWAPGTSVVSLGDTRMAERVPPTRAHRWKDLLADAVKGASAPSFVWGFVRQLSPAFCIPANKELLGYWDRVDDRLYKIRHCLDITGQPRRLALFAPEIDPRMLIRARAAGLSIDDVLDALTGAAPPYRFTFLVDRAKQYAGVVQAFGSALQSALERKDAEELDRLRLTHQRNVLAQTTRVREWELQIAVRSLESVQARRTAVANRLAQIESLRDTGLIAEEWTQRIAQHTASGARMVEATLNFLGGALHLIPQVGSPFAMKYGGQELGSSVTRFAAGTKAVGDFSAALATSAALEASFTRRAEGWDHQVAQLRDELRQLDKDIAAAELRRDVAARAVELHHLSIEQVEELDELSREKFTGLGLYTWLASSLQRIHRDAYNCAVSVARMAERAYRFERDDQVTTLLSGDYWSPTYSGLLAGSALLVELEQLEKRYLETTTRELELDQTFSLFQIDPAALVTLKQTGAATFELPELFFDLNYPGHFRRRIKAVRLTIPCVTGPHTNVSATLTLLDSSIRPTATPGAPLVSAPPARDDSVAASTAQNDAGVFELSFRDERYMPFEGAGAVSTWRLDLPDPRGFPPFDYETISDVLLRISYTAQSDGVLRDHVQQQNAALAGTLAHAVDTRGLRRVVSLRHEHAAAFQQLVAAPTGTEVAVDIGPRHFPLFLAGRNLEVRALRLAVVGPDGVGALALTFDGHAVTGFAADPLLGGLPVASVGPLAGSNAVAVRPLAVTAGGDVAGADGAALDRAAVRDILLVVDYAPGS